MPIIETVCDIFDLSPSKYAIVHQANCIHTMGSGIAKIIAQKYPKAVEADKVTIRGDRTKLGTFSVSMSEDDRVIFNAYGQYNYGGERATNYEALFKALQEISLTLIKHPRRHLAIPYGIGCGLGGGSWRVVRAMIEVIFEHVSYEVVICRLPNQSNLL